MTTNSIPRLRFHGRSLSARDPPILDQQNECKTDGKKSNFLMINWFLSAPRQHRLLPNVPDKGYSNSEVKDEERLFVRSPIRNSCSFLSPSEERIRRNQELQFVKSGNLFLIFGSSVLWCLIH